MKHYSDPELEVFDFEVIDVTNNDPTESNPFGGSGENDGPFGNSLEPIDGGYDNRDF